MKQFIDKTASFSALYRLEGTVHVNMSLVLMFMKNYFFSHVQYPEITVCNKAKDDSNIFEQKMGGLAKVKFPDYSVFILIKIYMTYFFARCYIIKEKNLLAQQRVINILTEAYLKICVQCRTKITTNM